MKMVAALAGAAALLLPTSAAPDATPYTIVGGTWVSGWSGRLVGPAWWLDGTSATYGVTLVGPDGFTRHMGGPNQRFPGMPSTRSTYWCSCDVNPGGSWYALGDGDHTKVSFAIDTSSRMAPVVFTQYSGDATTITASWNAEPDAKSFIAYVQDEGDDSAADWTVAGKVLPAGSTTVAFSDMVLNPDWAYEFDVFAFSGDIVNGPAPPVFNVASSRIDFVPSVLASHGPYPVGPSPCQACIHPIVPYVHKCGSVTAGKTWSLSSTMPTSCFTAKTILHAYVKSSCAKSCTVKSYRCTSAVAHGATSVQCHTSKKRVMFHTTERSTR